MRLISNIVAVVLMFSGGLFFLQGMSVLPSRVMYGRPEWVVIGGAMVIGGVALAVFATMRANRSAQSANQTRNQPP